jgi:hypothetical protein
MLKLAADENFNNDIVRGLLRRERHLDRVRIQDVGLSGATDPELLAWAAREGRVLLTHDVSTLRHFAYERVYAGLPMPGVFEVEFSDNEGRTYASLALRSDQIMVLHHDLVEVS